MIRTYRFILAIHASGVTGDPTMDDLAQRVLWVTSLVLPTLVFLVFRSSRWLTDQLAAAAAIASGWLFNLAYVIAAQAIAVQDASEVNGAVLAFGLVLGWVLPSVLVALTWSARYVIRRRCGRGRLI